jgi:predicted RNase H-like HicB family nuclease
MNLDLTVYLTKEGRHYVAHAMPLDVVSSGPTPEAAREAVYEAVRAFLLTAVDQGTLEEVLEECGYRRQGQVVEVYADGRVEIQD